jgi:hypothetical protein
VEYQNPKGFVTDDKENWADSPTRQPNLLYRYRFAWGRDNRELFPIDGRAALSLGAVGQRWGKLDSVSGQVIYQQELPASATGSIRQFRVQGKGSVQEKVYSLSSDFEHIYEIGGKTGEVTVEEFPFLLVAVPEPFSIKNPIDTNVFIRLANFTNPIVSGTITLHLDDVLQSNLQVEEFFEGLGGFDVTWVNSFSFDYGAQVNVKWIFFDNDVPANRFIIRYPFYTVQDLAGPRISNLIPADATTDVPIDSIIQFDVEDFELDVDLDSLIIYINSIKIINGQNGIIETIRFENERGYTVRVSVDKPWLYGDLIPVAIFVKDLSPNKNETFFSYSFTTIESFAPRLINANPAACTTSVPVGTDVSVDVIDGGHGLDKDTIVFTVEEVEETTEAQTTPIIHRDE